MASRREAWRTGQIRWPSLCMAPIRSSCWRKSFATGYIPTHIGKRNVLVSLWRVWPKREWPSKTLVALMEVPPFAPISFLPFSFALLLLHSKLNSWGGRAGNKKPTKFMCLLLKMLQLQPEKEIVVEFIRNEDYRYVRLLGAFYLRLVGKPLEIYNYLEPLYADYRRVRRRMPASTDGSNQTAGCITVHIDDFIDELLHSNYSCDVTLPFLPKRYLANSVFVVLSGRGRESRESREECMPSWLRAEVNTSCDVNL